MLLKERKRERRSTYTAAGTTARPTVSIAAGARGAGAGTHDVVDLVLFGRRTGCFVYIVVLGES